MAELPVEKLGWGHKVSLINVSLRADSIGTFQRAERPLGMHTGRTNAYNVSIADPSYKGSAGFLIRPLRGLFLKVLRGSSVRSPGATGDRR